MNRLFYTICTFIISVTLIVVISNNDSGKTQQENIEPVKLETNIEPLSSQFLKESLISNAVFVEKTSIAKTVAKKSSGCKVNNGQVVDGGCEQIQYIDEMNLSKYTNLVIHDDPRLIYENGKKINPLNKIMGIYELGDSDQGKVYQFLFYANCEYNDVPNYFLNSKVNCDTSTALESEFKIIKNNYNGNEVITLDIENGFSITSLVDTNKINCIGSIQHSVHAQNNLGGDFLQCNEQSKVVTEAYIELNDPVVAKCIFGMNYSPGKVYSVDPEKVISLNCPSLEGADISILNQFINLSYFAVHKLGDDLSYLNSFQSLKLFQTENSERFDLNAIANLTQLIDLRIIESNIVNSVDFNFGNIQLTHLDLNSSTIESLEFLTLQNALISLDLAYMNLEIVPLIGNGNGLQHLNIRNNNIRNIDGLERYIDLVTLDISKNKIDIMSNLSFDNGVFKSIKALGNPLDCDDPNLKYSPIVMSGCNNKLKKLMR